MSSDDALVEHKDTENEELIESLQNVDTFTTIWKTKYYFILFITMFIYTGFFYSLPGVLFNTLMVQIDTNEQTMSTLYSYHAVSGVCLAIFAGYIVDKIVNIHYLLAFICSLGCLALCTVYHIKSYTLMIFIWIIMPFITSMIIPIGVVLIYRVYNINGSWITAFNIFLIMVSATICAP
eukprot:96239_1